MMPIRRARGFAAALRPLVLALPLLVLTACDDDDDDGGTGPTGTGTVVLEFDHVVSDPSDATSTTALAFDSMDYTNAFGESYSVTKLVYIVSAFELHAGGVTRHAGVEADRPHLRDARDDATRTITITDVPVGDYDVLEFVHGVPEEHNANGSTYFDDTFESMVWPDMLGGGWHYMKLEGNWENAAADSSGGYATHTGHNRNGSSVLTDHSIDVELAIPGGMTVTADGTTTIRLTMDLNEWYQNPFDWSFESRVGVPTMPDFDAQTTLSMNGRGVWSIAEVR